MDAENRSPKEATARLREATEALLARRTLRETNVAPARPTEEALKKLDSSMKRNTALLRKLKQLGEDGRKALLDDIAKTNQAKYVSEAVAAVGEAPLKLKDIPAALAVCSALHQRYAEFAAELVPALCRVVSSKGATPEEDRGVAARKRATLRLLVELLLGGLYSSHSALLLLVKQLAAADFTRDADAALAAVSLLTAFAKAGREELLGLPHAEPAAVADDVAELAAAGEADAAACVAALEEYRAELAQRWALAPEEQARFRAAAERLFEAACTALQSAHELLSTTERDNERVLNNRGDLPETLAAAYEAQRAAFEALQRGTAALGEVLEKPVPELQEAVTRMAAGPEASTGGTDAAGGGDAALLPFDDEETKAFYEGLPDLRAVVPAVLLGETDSREKDKGVGEEEGAAAAESDSAADGGGGGEALAAAEEAAARDDEVKPLTLRESAVEGQLRKLQLTPSLTSLDAVQFLAEPASDGASVGVAPPGEAPQSPSAGAAEGASGQEGGARRALDVLFSRLRSCVSKELCDEVAVEFCYAGGAAKGARRRLARALCDVPHGSLQLLPYYGRVAAILAPVFPDVATAMAAHLEAEFLHLSRRKDATMVTLEPRLRNARYVAELVKFRLFPAGTAFSMLKLLLDEFSGHNVDAACALVEGAGRYLSRRPDTATRLNNMLDVMVKLRNARNLDARQGGLVDSAYHAVRTSGAIRPVKQRPVTHEYVRHLIYSRLAPYAVSTVMKRLRRLDWEQDGDYVLRTLLRASRKGRFSQVPLLAALAAGLSRYHPELGVGVVDAVMEEVTAGMEVPEAALYQRRVAAVRLLGELYCYKLANTTLVFNTLQALVSPPALPPGAPPEAARRLDPPTNYFRIRLVCTLLESCGSYFTRGCARRRLDDFVPYLQRYVLSKPPLPLDVELDLQELYSRLRVDPPRFESYEAACVAVAEAEAKAAAAAASGLAPIEEEEEGGGEVEDDDDEFEAELEDGGSASDASGSDGESESEHESDSEDESDLEEAADEEEEEEEEEDLGREVERTPAEDEFDQELAALLGDSSRPGTAALLAPGPSTRMPRPAPAPAAAAAAAAAETLAFRVMVKRGGRDDRSRELAIPLPAGVAEGLRDKEAREAAERAEVKRMVLEADLRDSMEQAPGLYAQGGPQRSGGRGAAGYYRRGRGARALW